MVGILDDYFNPQTFASQGIPKGLLDMLPMWMQQTRPAQPFPSVAPPESLPGSEGPSPLDTAQWPHGPKGGPSDDALPPAAAPTIGATPLSMAPQQQEQGQGFLERIGLTPNALMALGAGIAGGKDWGDSVSKGVSGLVAARQQNQTEQALIKRGLDPTMSRTVAQNPTLMASVAGQLFKPQVRALTPAEKQSFGLPANVPWFMGSDNKPFVPEGVTAGKMEITKDANGNPIAVDPYNPGAPATTVGTGAPPKPKFDDVASVRKEISALPEVKRYGEAVPIFRSMVKSKDVDTSAADLDFVYGVAKVFDPESVVREGEMKLVGSAQSLPEDIKAMIGSVALAKGRLTPEARDRILQVAQTRMTELRGAYDTRLQPYSEYASRSNIDVRDIMPGLPDMPDWKMPVQQKGANPPQGNNTQPPRTRVLNGKTYYQDFNGNWFEQR